ncbi:MAG: TrkH family potassium uptake protein [Acidobacteriota bacterium]|nr:MAG: TrkH family potassium uptake protein [Acidobacteriota bacterium]
MNYRTVARLLGILLVVVAFCMATSIGWAAYYAEWGTLWAFVSASLLTLLIGGGLYFWGRRESGTIGRREALLVVTAGWVMIGLTGALPYMFDGAFTNFADAFFETVSGFTTTGSTVLTNIEGISNGLHYWRALTHWLGGMGIVVLFIAIFPQLGVGAKHLFKSEVPGPITDGLKPKIRETASVLWKIYVGLTALECVLLYFAGMSVFDAVCHSFATMATGGFSTKNASVAQFESVPIDIIITLFMLLAGINFALYFAALRGRLFNFFRDAEFRVYLGLVVLATLAVSIDILSIHGDPLQALRYGAFQVVAIVTTTGFGTDNFDLYPSFSKILLVALMFVGGSAGSTAGGMKISRIMVLSKAAFVEVYHIFRPQAVRTVRLGRSIIPDEVTRSIFGFFALAAFVFVSGSLFMALLGLDIVSATTSVVATLFNIGPGLAKVGAVENFAFIPTPGKIFLSFCMILGRLEFYTILVLLVPDFWKR